MITKPSELSVPVPKLFINVSRHEVWGAIRGSELGDGTLETESDASGGRSGSLSRGRPPGDVLRQHT